MFCFTPAYAFADEIDDLTNQYNTAIQRKNELQIELDQLNIQLQETQEKLEKKQKALDKTTKEMYRNQNPKYLIDMILDSKSVSDFFDTWDYYSKIGEQQAQQVEAIQEIQEKLEKQQVEYNVLLKEADKEIAVARAAKQEAAERLAAQQANQTREIFNAKTAVSGSDTFYVSGSIVVERAYSQLGKPYVWGAVGPNSYDCSGLVSYCLSGQNTRLGTTYTFMGWARVLDPQPGDICVNNGHCGIYIGNGQMIHAPQSGDVVKIGPVQSSMIYVRA